MSFNYPKTEEIIEENINWLNRFIAYKDQGFEKNHSYAQKYADVKIKTVSRVKSFIEESEENLTWLHDFLLKAKLDNEIFLTFFKLWSKQITVLKPQPITRVIFEKDLWTAEAVKAMEN